MTAEGAAGRWRRDELDVALPGAGRAIQTVASVLLMVDPRDLGLVSQIRSPHHEAPTIYLYEAVPGGVGLSERLWKRHDELIAGAADLITACACEAGCPACTGPRLEPHVDAKALALRLLGDLGAPVATPGGQPMIEGGATLAHRLERYRAAAHTLTARDDGPPIATPSAELAERLAAATDGEVVVTPEGIIVRCEVPARSIPVDRRRLATLPGQPPPQAPLVCLDTETTGLATAAGTVAFLIGLGWWEGDRFRQVQLLLPDHAHERALLTALAATIAPTAWLVTYNGRGFDWPLLVARYRLARRSAPLACRAPRPSADRSAPVPPPDGRRQAADGRGAAPRAPPGRRRRRLGDPRPLPAIPAQRLGDELVEVVRHNDQDVRSLARLLVHLEVQLGDPDRRAEAAPGDLAGLARAFAREHRLGEALACLDDAADAADSAGLAHAVAQRPGFDGPRRGAVVVAAYAGRFRRARPTTARWPRAAPNRGVPRSVDRRAHHDRSRPPAPPPRPARRGSRGLAIRWPSGPGRPGIVASIELAKLHEHRLRDREAAICAAHPWSRDRRATATARAPRAGARGRPASTSRSPSARHGRHRYAGPSPSPGGDDVETTGMAATEPGRTAARSGTPDQARTLDQAATPPRPRTRAPDRDPDRHCRRNRRLHDRCQERPEEGVAGAGRVDVDGRP